MGEEAARRNDRGASMSWLRENATLIVAGLVVLYMLLPIAVIIVLLVQRSERALQLHLGGLHARPLDERVRRSRTSTTRS